MKEQGEAEIVLNMFFKKTDFLNKINVQSMKQYSPLDNQEIFLANINETLYKKYHHEMFNNTLFIPINLNKTNNEKNFSHLNASSSFPNEQCLASPQNKTGRAFQSLCPLKKINDEGKISKSTVKKDADNKSNIENTEGKGLNVIRIFFIIFVFS